MKWLVFFILILSLGLSHAQIYGGGSGNMNKKPAAAGNGGATERTLKGTDIDTSAIIVLAISSLNDSMLVEYVNNWTSTLRSDGGWTNDSTRMTVDSLVTITKSTTWKGTEYVAVNILAKGSWESYTVNFPSPSISVPGDVLEEGFGFFAALRERSAGNGRPTFFGANGFGITSSKLQCFVVGIWRGDAGDSDIPTATKIGVAGNYSGHETDGIQEPYYGLESDSIYYDVASPGTPVDNYGFSTVINLGTETGQGNLPFSFYIFCLFDRRLTEAEYQRLHDDPFGVLFD